MASDTESEVGEVRENAVIVDDIVDPVNTKVINSESAVWRYFKNTNKPNQEGTGSHHMGTSKQCGKSIKTTKGNTSNLISHVKTKHCKIYEEVRKITNEKRNS